MTLPRIAAALRLLCAAGALSGCATMLHGRTQQVRIETNPSGLMCRVGSDPVLTVGPTPTTVLLRRGDGPMPIRCMSAGTVLTASATPHVSSAVWGNVLFGGLVGASMDAADGAEWTYPTRIVVGPPVGNP